MTTIAPPRVVRLDPVLHGLVDPAGGTRDLDAMLAQARAAELGGAAAVTIPAGSAPGGRQWPSTAQALAVLLATSTVHVVVEVSAAAWTPDALARFAAQRHRSRGPAPRRAGARPGVDDPRRRPVGPLGGPGRHRRHRSRRARRLTRPTPPRETPVTAPANS